jgi:hypothetical protein
MKRFNGAVDQPRRASATTIKKKIRRDQIVRVFSSASASLGGFGADLMAGKLAGTVTGTLLESAVEQALQKHLGEEARAEHQRQ